MSDIPSRWPSVRVAKTDDADAAALVLRRSITDLCQMDYADQPGRLEQWLANKTPSQVQSWMSQDSFFLYVAERESKVVGVGGINDQGMILLNYVDPDWRSMVTSSALLSVMEDTARRAGRSNTTLESTKTAERFYRAHGYRSLPREKAPSDGLWLFKELT